MYDENGDLVDSSDILRGKNQTHPQGTQTHVQADRTTQHNVGSRNQKGAKVARVRMTTKKKVIITSVVSVLVLLVVAFYFWRIKPNYLPGRSFADNMKSIFGVSDANISDGEYIGLARERQMGGAKLA